MMSRQDTLQHEAAHAVFALAQGHRVAKARVGAVGDGLLGSVEVEAAEDLYGHLITTLAGPMATGQLPPPWPPDPAAADGTDEREAAMCVHVGGITREQYITAAAICAHLLDDPSVKEAIALVADKLGTLETLTHLMVRDALTPELREWIDR
jgi:hypothetical protein